MNKPFCEKCGKGMKIIPRLIKQGHCQYPGCKINLGEVHIAVKFCPPHKIQKIKEDKKSYQRKIYKSKFHREKTISKKWNNPRPLPPGITEGSPCPRCGAIIYRERVIDQKGYTTNFFDYVCGTHRFPDPRGGKMR